MKKLIVLLLVLLLIGVGTAIATKSSGSQSASAAIHTGRCYLKGVYVFAPSADATITVYDNTSAAGKIVWGPQVVLTGDQYGGVNFPEPGIEMATGVYVTISGASATYIVNFLPR